MSLIESVGESRWDHSLYDPAPSDYCCRVAARYSCYYGLRDILERGLGLIMLVLAAPLIAVLVLAIRLTSKGPGIYRQRRVGLGGRVFTMYKLRSMRCNAEDRTGPVWASVCLDPRVTPLGHWLRHLHLDELPQLYNIVRGEMSLVGPRPERPEFVSLLAGQIPDYLDRLQVKPGITGLAQVNLPPDTDLRSVRRKLVLDLEYIHAAGPLLDARIALCTLLRLIGLRGGRAVTLLGLTRVIQLPDADDRPSDAAREFARQTQPPVSAPLVAARS
jgi:lipopolysaccharide/colanic/teichoic acid biosynthesis glycosyltransferase